MSYVSNISNISYNHLGTNFDGRFNDLYVDGDLIGPTVVGPTGPTGPAGPAFVDGWSVSLSSNQTISATQSRILYDSTSAVGFVGDYNVGSHSATINTTGKYLVTSQVTFTWTDAVVSDRPVSLNLYINGVIQGQSLCIYPVSATSTSQTLTFARVMYLTTGASVHTEIQFSAVQTNTVIGGNGATYFSAQRIA